MYRKFNNKKLLIIFVALLLVVILISIIDNTKGDRSFTKNLVDVDTADITKLEIGSLKDGKTITLEKSSGIWKVKKEGVLYNTDATRLAGVIDLLSKMQPSGVITDSKEKWADYNATDSLGLRVKVFADKKKKADIIIGRFSAKKSNNPYNRNPSFKTYIRPYKEKNVYVVDQLMLMSFTTDFNSYRDHNIVKVNPMDIRKISFEYPADSSFTLENINGVWNIDNMTADSAGVVNYLNSLRNVTHTTFVDNKPLGTPSFKMTVEGNNIIKPIVITSTLMDGKKIIQSSMNNDAFFDAESSDIFNRLFKGKGNFIQKP